MAFEEEIVAHVHRISRASGTSNLAETLGTSEDIELEDVRIHLEETSSSGVFTVTLDSGASTNHDVVLKSLDMAGVKDFTWTPERKRKIARADELDFAHTIGTSSNSWGLEVHWNPLS